MTTPTREDLLGFVLGALEAEEHQQVTDCLQRHPELELELQRIKAQLAPLQQTPTPTTDFPVGLARRACEVVARESRRTCSPVTSEATIGDSKLPSNADSQTVSVRAPESRAPRRQAIIMVCCAAVLGAALGPTAIRVSQAFVQSSVAPAAIAANKSPIRVFRAAERISEPRRRTGLSSERHYEDHVIALNETQRSPSFISSSESPSDRVASRNLANWDDRITLWSERKLSMIDESDVAFGDSFTSSLSQIGSRPLIDPSCDSWQRFDVQFVSN